MKPRTYDLKRLSSLDRYITKYLLEGAVTDEQRELIEEYEYLKTKYPDWKQEREVNHYEKMRPKINKPRR